MEIITGLVVPALGGLVWLVMMLGNLKGRLDTLEGKKHFERAEQEFTQKLEAMIDAAQQRLNNELNPERMVQQIEIAQQRAVQQIEELLSNFSELKTALQELEVAKQRALSEITQASSSERLLAIEQQINQSVEEFRSKIAAVVNQADARRLALEQEAALGLGILWQQILELKPELIPRGIYIPSYRISNTITDLTGSDYLFTVRQLYQIELGNESRNCSRRISQNLPYVIPPNLPRQHFKPGKSLRNPRLRPIPCGSIFTDWAIVEMFQQRGLTANH